MFSSVTVFNTLDKYLSFAVHSSLRLLKDTMPSKCLLLSVTNTVLEAVLINLFRASLMVISLETFTALSYSISLIIHLAVYKCRGSSKWKRSSKYSVSLLTGPTLPAIALKPCNFLYSA